MNKTKENTQSQHFLISADARFLKPTQKQPTAMTNMPAKTWPQLETSSQSHTKEKNYTKKPSSQNWTSAVASIDPNARMTKNRWQM